MGKVFGDKHKSIFVEKTGDVKIQIAWIAYVIIYIYHVVLGGLHGYECFFLSFAMESLKKLINLITEHSLKYIYTILPGFNELANCDSIIDLIKKIVNDFSDIRDANTKLQCMKSGVEDIYK